MAVSQSIVSAAINGFKRGASSRFSSLSTCQSNQCFLPLRTSLQSFGKYDDSLLSAPSLRTQGGTQCTTTMQFGILDTVPQRAISWIRRHTLSVVLDSPVSGAHWRSCESLFKYSSVLARSPYTEKLYRPSGLSMSLNSSSVILEEQFKCREKQSGVRGFAKTVQVPQSMQRPMKLKLYMGSPGVIGEPYKPPSPPLPLFQRWLTKEGWARRRQSFMGMIKTSYTIAKLRQKTKGYSQQRFYQEASDLYKQINSALAEGERTALRHLVTDSVFSVGEEKTIEIPNTDIMKNELKHRESSTWAKVDWVMVGPVSKMRTLQGRLIGVDKNNHDNAFVQLTVRINSKQKFAAYDKRGKLVAGDPDKELLVEDIWVFEKPLLLTEAKWRLCARLSI